jgi:hypothetical protein
LLERRRKKFDLLICCYACITLLSTRFESLLREVRRDGSKWLSVLFWMKLLFFLLIQIFLCRKSMRK